MRRQNTVCVMVKSNLTMFLYKHQAGKLSVLKDRMPAFSFGVLPRYLSFALILAVAGAGLRRHAARRAFALALH